LFCLIDSHFKQNMNALAHFSCMGLLCNSLTRQIGIGEDLSQEHRVAKKRITSGGFKMINRRPRRRLE